jgi:hypothetical protein
VYVKASGEGKTPGRLQPALRTTYHQTVKHLENVAAARSSRTQKLKNGNATGNQSEVEAAGRLALDYQADRP